MVIRIPIVIRETLITRMDIKSKAEPITQTVTSEHLTKKKTIVQKKKKTKRKNRGKKKKPSIIWWPKYTLVKKVIYCYFEDEVGIIKTIKCNVKAIYDAKI